MALEAVAGPKVGYLVKAFGVLEDGKELQQFFINRRELDEHDICIDVKYCGICHSDLNCIKNERKKTAFPFVPGHEIIGVVSKIGSNVTKFKEGDIAGVGVIADSCRNCQPCKNHEEQYCMVGPFLTINSPSPKDGGVTVCGGFSEKMIIDERFAVKVSDRQNLDKIAPLLCAGITMFSPLKYLKTNENSRVAIVGLGGLGHIGVKLAKAMKAEVSVISRSASKLEAALKLGVRNFIISTNESQMKDFKNKFDIILDTASGNHEITDTINLLDTNGTLVLLGLPPKPYNVRASPMITRRRKIMGSACGSPFELQEMIDFCEKNKVFPDVELITVDKVNAALDTLSKGDIAHRYVLDVSTLK